MASWKRVCAPKRRSSLVMCRCTVRSLQPSARPAALSVAPDASSVSSFSSSGDSRSGGSTSAGGVEGRICTLRSHTVSNRATRASSSGEGG